MRLKTGEVFYETVYISPRLPPQISLRHEWTKELGSKIVQQPEGESVRQPEGEVVRQTKFFQSTQPTPNPIGDRSGQLDDMQDERNTSFSQEINGKFFLTKNSVPQIQQGDLLLIQLQYKTTPKYVMQSIRSTVMMKYFAKEWRNPLLFMTIIMKR